MVTLSHSSVSVINSLQLAHVGVYFGIGTLVDGAVLGAVSTPFRECALVLRMVHLLAVFTYQRSMLFVPLNIDAYVSKVLLLYHALINLRVE